VFIVVVYFVIDSVRKLVDTPSYLDVVYFNLNIMMRHVVMTGALLSDTSSVDGKIILKWILGK
jgi:hypothetical protein